MTDKEILEAESAYRQKQRKIVCKVLRASLDSIQDAEEKELVQNWIDTNSGTITFSGAQLMEAVNRMEYGQRLNTNRFGDKQ